MIDFGKQEEVDFKLLAKELCEFVDDVVDELGSREEISYVNKILDNGTGADRQIEVWEETKDYKKLMEYIIEETHRGLPVQ
jgi:carboxylate-amine ligase